MFIYFDILKFNLLRSFVYPYEVISAFLRKFIDLGMVLLFWYILSKSTNISFNTRNLSSYFLISGAVNEFVMTSNLNFGRDIQKLIKNGNLTNFTIKPLKTIPYLLFTFIGQRGVAFAIAGISLIVGMLVKPPIAISNIFMFLLYLTIAAGISFGINILIANIGFLTPEAGSVKNVVLHMLRVLSGALIPLSFYPHSIRVILMFTPFPFLVFGPTNALTSFSPTANVLENLLVGFIWAIILVIASLMTWKYSFKRYDAIGI